MSQSAMSMPLSAPAPTTPVMPCAIMALKDFCQSRSISPGSSPTSSGVRSCTARSTTRGQPLHSPTPVMPASV